MKNRNIILRKLSNRSINIAKQQAGPRYSPGISSNFPSLEIKELVDIYDGLLRNNAFWNRIKYYKKEYTKLLENNFIFAKGLKLPERVSPDAKRCRSESRKVYNRICKLEELKNNTFKTRNIEELTTLVETSLNMASSIHNKILRRDDEPNYLEDKHWRDASHASHLQSESNELLNTIYEFNNFINSLSVKYCDKPISLLLGRAGQLGTRLATIRKLVPGRL